MKERPILFSTPMVQAILDGSKTQTRRVIKGAPTEAGYGAFLQPSTTPGIGYAGFCKGPSAESPGLGCVKCPYGVPGDRLWVREAWMLPTPPDEGMIAVDYRACLEAETQGCDRVFLDDVTDAMLQDALRIWDADVRHARSGWRPGIHMPRWASRLLLEITDVRVERLQSISEADAQAEGAPAEFEVDLATFVHGKAIPSSTHYLGFKHLWRDINGEDSWQANPWAWVVSFKPISL